MAWIKVDQSLPSHRKTLIASDALGVEAPVIIGHLTMLWLWAIDNAPDGYLDGIPSGVIARAVQWRGDAESFMSALVQAGFIDETEAGKEIHNWEEYAGKLIEKRRTDAERLKNYRESKKETESVQRTYNVRNTDVAGKSRLEKSRVDITSTTYLAQAPEKPVKKETKEPKPLREDQLIWDALAESIGSSPTTKSERGKWNHAIKELKDAGVTAAQIPSICEAYRKHWPGIDVTPTGITGNLSILTQPKPEEISRVKAEERQALEAEGAARKRAILDDFLSGKMKVGNVTA